MKKPKILTIEPLPINTCFLCKKPFNVIRVETLTDVEGLNKIEIRTEHITCQRYRENLEKLDNEISMSIIANKFHQCYIKDLKQQKNDLAWDFFSTI
jgi:hypothetical protein